MLQHIKSSLPDFSRFSPTIVPSLNLCVGIISTYTCRGLNLASSTMMRIVQPTLVLGMVMGPLPPPLPHSRKGSTDELASIWENMSALPGGLQGAGLQWGLEWVPTPNSCASTGAVFFLRLAAWLLCCLVLSVYLDGSHQRSVIYLYFIFSTFSDPRLLVIQFLATANLQSLL